MSLIYKLRKNRFCVFVISCILAPVYNRYDTKIHDFTDKDRTNIFLERQNVLFSKIRFGMTAEEHYLFKFNKKTYIDKSEFVSHSERRKIISKYYYKSNRPWIILKDKWKTYLCFKDYFKREACLIDGQESFESFISFASNHEKFIIKPIDEARGTGIQIYDSKKSDKTPEELFYTNLIKGKYIAEELIEQASEMAKFHPESINTIRLVTWLDDDNAVRKIFALVRMGIGSSIVDNAGAGGGIASVDIDTGIITSDLMREDGKSCFKMHPDTNVQIKKSRIPKWNECLKFADEVSHVVPNLKWIGWDFALTDKGWVLVEANQSPSFVGIQMCTDKGIRPLIMNTIGKEVTIQ